jgi:hypothetical protein
MISSAFMEIISQMAPETAKVIEQFQKSKINDKQVMITLLALNLEQAKKSDCILQEVRGLKGALTTKGVI